MNPPSNSLFFNKILQEALTFDDILLVPGYSEILPHETDVSTSISRFLKLKLPILSAAMDTITEHELATTMARLGGLGIIHKNLTPTEQADEVRLVKQSESGVVLNPLFISPEDTVEIAVKIIDLNLRDYLL